MVEKVLFLGNTGEGIPVPKWAKSAHPLYKLSNVIMMPHYAGGSRFGALDEWNQIFDNCRVVLAVGRVE